MDKCEARKANHEEVVEEARREKLPKNFEARKRRAEWELQNEEKKKVRGLHIFIHLSLSHLVRPCIPFFI